MAARRPDLVQLAHRELLLQAEESAWREREAERRRRRRSVGLRRVESVVAEAVELRLREDEAESLSASFMRLSRRTRMILILATYLLAMTIAVGSHVSYAAAHAPKRTFHLTNG